MPGVMVKPGPGGGSPPSAVQLAPVHRPGLSRRKQTVASAFSTASTKKTIIGTICAWHTSEFTPVKFSAPTGSNQTKYQNLNFSFGCR